MQLITKCKWVKLSNFISLLEVVAAAWLWPLLLLLLLLLLLASTSMAVTASDFATAIAFRKWPTPYWYSSVIQLNAAVSSHSLIALNIYASKTALRVAPCGAELTRRVMPVVHSATSTIQRTKWRDTESLIVDSSICMLAGTLLVHVWLSSPMSPPCSSTAETSTLFKRRLSLRVSSSFPFSFSSSAPSAIVSSTSSGTIGFNFMTVRQIS